MIRILMVEDQYFARLALRTVIDGRADMQIVAETQSGLESLALYRQHKPDVVIMDLRLPGMSGFDAIRAIRIEDEAARIVVLSNYDGSEDVHRAIEAGAVAYLTKDASAEELVQAIEWAMRGKRYVPPALAQLLEHRHPADQLTARELEVVELLTQGMSNQDIGATLGIAEKTVRIHMTHIFEKLGVTDRTQAVITAVQRGLVHWK
ncbi:MAG: response regulator transcription factor [Bryobacteraceae bacterium]